MRRRPQARPLRRSHLLPFLAVGAIGLLAIALVIYLLWPTWDAEQPADPSHLPMVIGNVPFNVPTNSIRVKLQKRTGPQERVDLNFEYPSLAPPDAQAHVTAETVKDDLPQIDRIFLSIIAHHDALSPDERLRTIYPRYLDSNPARVTDGLSVRPFRDNTPYTSEDLVYSSSPQFVARCMRDGVTPGMCLSERRIDGADITFRFPRAWLAQWRDVASAMDQLVGRMRKSR
jgi:hypothetical protein